MLFSLSPSFTTITPPSLLLPTTTFSTLRHHWTPLPPLSFSTTTTTTTFSFSGGGISGGGGSSGGSGPNNWWDRWFNNNNNDDDGNNGNHIKGFLLCLLLTLVFQKCHKAYANVQENDKGVVFEVKGGRKTKLYVDELSDEFVVAEGGFSVFSGFKGLKMESLWVECREVFMRLMLPEGYPESVTSDYLEYSVWRGVQGVAAQVSSVLATQSLLYAVGLGKGAIPTAAAVNWVLKDGIGYLSKIFLSKFGRHFDVNPKGWRLFADFLENAAFGMEIVTPAFPHLFVPIGAAAGAGRSAAALIQAATRSCFYAGFAAQRNFAEVIAKGEAQGMVSKSIGILLGIALANCIQASTPLALASFGAVTWIHMFCNLKSYQSIQLRTLNPYRASTSFSLPFLCLVFGEYLLSGLVPSVKEVNDEEPFFPALPLISLKPASKAENRILSPEAKEAAATIEQRLELGSKLSDIVKTKTDAHALLDLYKNQGYILTPHNGKVCTMSSRIHDLADLKIPLERILSATNNFDDKNLIAIGGYAKKYTGNLLWSRELIEMISARRFNKDKDEMFWTEVSMLSSLKHQNLVSLLGFCDENGEKVIITRRETKGSLSKYLSDAALLTWVQKLEISVGLARALSYIHYDEPRDFSVIHRDINSSTVLLNDNFEPKLSGFEKSMKIEAFQRHHSFHNSKVWSRDGYTDPSYEKTKFANHKADMYSFGIVLFELLCGRTSIIPNDTNKYLAPVAILHYKEKKLGETIDWDSWKQMDPQSFNVFAETAYECLNEEQSQRPSINEIVTRLEKALELQLERENIEHSVVEGSSSCIDGQFQHLKIELEAIKSATNEFDDSHCIGKGGFGKVYKGELVHSKGQSVVALKRLNRAFGQGNPEFWKEIIMLSLYRHDNIVSLLGFCDDCGEKILVYEYASKKSLDMYLNDKDLTWVQRLEICIGAARGLAYLHDPGLTQQRVLHRDIKSSNILLDENWNARIADLGLSKFGPANQKYTFLVSHAVGTIGYIDPLYAETGLLTKESDVYSFGVVLFEMLCGRLCFGSNHDKRQPLIGLVRKCYEQKTMDDIIFGNIKDEINPHSLKAFTTIAYQCLMREREHRPLMTNVVNVLESALKAQVSNEPPTSSLPPAEADLLDGKMLTADDTPKVGVPVALAEGPWIQYVDVLNS